jgi:predicted CXXCH cytochrome family protein
VPPVPSHAPFLVSNGAPHYQKSCLACHVAARTDKTWATDFTKPERCTGCHTDPITSASHFGSYSGYPGTYSYTDPACLSCHPAGHMGPFDHTSGFPIAANDVHHSSAAACTSCHTNTSTPTNLTTINCVGCHSNSTASVDPGGIDSRHTTPHLPVTIAGYSWDSLACLKCHAGTVAAPAWTDPLKFTLAQHSSSCFGIIGGAHSVSQVNGTTPICFTCHNTMNAAARTWGINWAQGQCAPCHNDGRTATCR